jgi:hypothetical protein
MQISYEGAQDGGLLSALAGLMKDIAPKRYDVSALYGLDYVPRDNYVVNAHEGEAVLTKAEAEEWRSGNRGNSDILYQIAKNTAKMAKILDRFDYDGLPAERTLA